MSRPTEEQIKALKPGDRFLAEYEYAGGSIECGIVYANNVDGEHSCAVAFSAIHSIVPREIKVGDTVNTSAFADDEDPGVVVSISDNRAWVDWGRLGHSVQLLSVLRVVS
jgi:hypothetical protein